MAITLNQIWTEFCRNIQSPINTDYDRKIRAINFGLRHFIQRMIELTIEEHLPGDLLVTPTNISNSDNVNYVSLPSDFMKLHKLWRKQGSYYYALDGQSVIPFDQLLTYTNNNFFDTSYTGDILYAAIKEPRIYFDKFFDGSGTDKIKISYWKVPTEIIGYDSLGFINDTGLETGEIITGNTSGASARIYEITSVAGFGNLNYYLDGWNNVAFNSLETITGATSGNTALSTGVTTKPETFDFMDKYKMILVECAALQWHIFRGSDEIEGRSATVDNMLMNMSKVNYHKTQLNWGNLGNVR